MKFENGLSLEMMKAVGILEISYFLMLIHNCKFLKEFEISQNNKSRYFGPQTN